MRLFRRHGYEGVSLAMLTQAIGVAPPSLYSAFGSKADMYREVLDRYAEVTVLSLVEGGGSALTLDQSLARMFERAIEMVAGEASERGCMISTGLLANHPDLNDLALEVQARRAALVDRFAAELCQWLPVDRSRSLACFICAVLQGIAVQARDGASPEALQTIATTARSCVA